MRVENLHILTNSAYIEHIILKPTYEYFPSQISTQQYPLTLSALLLPTVCYTKLTMI